MISRRSFSSTVAVGLMAPGLFAPGTALANSSKLPALTEKAILRISGKIANVNDGALAVFDRAGIEALGMISFETMTPWYTSKVKFEGVPLITLLKLVGSKGDKLVVTALNDYATEIPIADIEAHNAILAIKRDGQYMPVTDKGPLFIVYNYDSKPELKSQKYYSRSAWQVARIEVR